MSDVMTEREYLDLSIAYHLSSQQSKIPLFKILSRQSKTGFVKRISPEVRSGIYDIKLLESCIKYADEIQRFKTIFDTNLSHCNNSAFYTNIESLTMKEVTEDTPKEDADTMNYNNRDNIILVNLLKEKSLSPKRFSREKTKSFSHELLHMSSTYKKGILRLSGFSQNVGDLLGVGHGLNEGYTELLNQRYFYPENDENTKDPIAIYPEEKIFAYGIERLVGRKTMEKLYFDADLDGLVAQISKYTDQQNAMDLIAKIDRYHNSTIPAQKSVLALEIKTEIANLNMKKLNEAYSNKKISKSTYELEHLRNAMYIKDHMVLQSPDNTYMVKKINSDYGIRISQEGYRILQNHFATQEEYDRPFNKYDCISTAQDIVGIVPMIWHAEKKEKRDLSQYERIIVIDPSEHLCHYVPRTIQFQQKSTIKDQLNEMFGEGTVTDSTKEQSKKIS